MNFHISKILNQRIFGKSLEAYEIYSEQRSSTFVEKVKGTLADEDRIINPSPKPIAADPDELNVHFTNTTQRNQSILIRMSEKPHHLFVRLW